MPDTVYVVYMVVKVRTLVVETLRYSTQMPGSSKLWARVGPIGRDRDSCHRKRFARPFLPSCTSPADKDKGRQDQHHGLLSRKEREKKEHKRTAASTSLYETRRSTRRQLRAQLAKINPREERARQVRQCAAHCNIQGGWGLTVVGRAPFGRV